jgi:predicted dehydrogenase
LIALFIGYGVIAKRHHEVLLKLLPDIKVYALRSSANSQTQNGVTSIYQLNELSVRPDIVLITNPTQKHYQAIKECLSFNSFLFIEKPLFDHAGIEELNLIKEIKASGVHTYIGCNLRFHPLLQKLKSILTNENFRINEANCYCGSYLPDWRPNRNFRDFYSVNPQLGGGVHLDVIHEIDYCYWLFGKPKEVQHLFRNKSSLQIEAIDYANYRFIYPDFCTQLTLNYYRPETKRYIEIITEKDIYYLDFVKNTLSKNNIQIMHSDAAISETFYKQMEYVLECMKNKKQPINGIEEAWEILNICLNEYAER